MYSPSHRLLHIHIPKCGGTSIEDSLTAAGVTLTDGRLQVTRRHVHEPAYVWRNQLGAERFSEAFVFAIVRHPGDLLVSLYHYQRDILPPPNPHWIPPHITFEAWMREHIAAVPRYFTQETSDLCWWLDDPTTGQTLVPPAHIWSLEDLPRAWPKLTAEWGIGPVPLSHRNASNHLPWQLYFAGHPDLVEIAQSRYSADIARFGWTFPE